SSLTRNVRRQFAKSAEATVSPSYPVYSLPSYVKVISFLFVKSSRTGCVVIRFFILTDLLKQKGKLGEQEVVLSVVRYVLSIHQSLVQVQYRLLYDKFYHRNNPLLLVYVVSLHVQNICIFLPFL